MGSMCFGLFSAVGEISAGILLTFRRVEPKLAADLKRYVVIDRAGVRLLIIDAQIREQLQNFVRLYFELPCQLVDSNFTHI